MSGTVPEADLEAYGAVHRPGIEAALERALADLATHVPGGVLEASRHGVLGGGKRLRPLLVVAAWEAVVGRMADAADRSVGGGERGVAERARGGATATAALYDLAASVEIVHAYSLMHDDLPCMDDAELRRGRPTTHVAHGEARTTVAGAALVPLAAGVALRAARALGRGDTGARAIARALLEGAGAGGMVGGQWLDLRGEGRALAQEELDDLHARKTGALLTAAPVMGGMAAGGDEVVVGALGAYGRALGLAFQIADDVLDATRSAAELGKNPSDAELEKSTYVALHGVGGARARARDQAARAREALAAAGLDAWALAALAVFAVERGR